MSYEERKAAFIQELRALIDKHQVGILGTDENESIYGEITLFDRRDLDASVWEEPEGTMQGQLDQL